MLSPFKNWRFLFPYILNFYKKNKEMKNVDFWSILAVTPKTKSQTLKFFFEKDKKPLIDRFHYL